MIDYVKYTIPKPKYNYQPPMAPYGQPTDDNVKQWQNLLKTYNEECDSFLVRLKQYEIETEKLNIQYKIDVLNDLGLTNHPKAEEVWKIATDISIQLANMNEDIEKDFFSEYIQKLAKLIV